MRSATKANEVDRVVGANIRYYREARGLSARELSQKLSVTTDLLEKYELGEKRVGASKLLELGRIFDIDAQLFFKTTIVKTSVFEGCRTIWRN
jgi:transcriptional regulator with XRE-family HTH domain